MMSYINETDFVIENKELVYPEIVTDGLQLYYDAKGKRDTDYHRDTMLDMSGNKNHGKLHNFAYEKHSGYKDGLVFDYIDDKLVRPTLNLQPNDFTFMLNGNIISFSPDGTVKRVQDGEVIEVKEDIPNAQDLIDCIEYKGNILGDMENIIDGLYKTEVLSGTEIYTDKADDSVVHVDIDGKSYQHAGSGKNLAPHFNHWKLSGGARVKNDVLYIPVGGNAEFVAEWNGRDAVPLYSFDIVKGKNAHGYSAYMDSTGKSVTEASNTWTGNGYAMTFNNVTRRTWAGQRLDSRTQTLRFSFTGSRTYVTEEYAIKNISLTYNGTNAIDYEPPAPSPKHPIEIHSLNDFDVVSSVGKENIIKNVNGRPSSMVGRGSTSPTVKLVDMKTPFGDEAFEITFPANNQTGYWGSRTETNIFTMYGGKSYSYHTYVYYPDGKASGVTIYPTGTAGMSPLNADTSKDIGDWKYYGRENYLLPSRYKTLNNYMSYYASSVFSSPKTIYVSVVKFEEGAEVTPYSPRPEDIIENDNHPLIDKINLLLDEPLRSVGDVKDRLFRDSDGLWKVERNVGEAAFDGTEDWGVWYTRDTSGMFGLMARNLEEPMLKETGLVVSNMFPSVNVNSIDEEGINIGTAPRLRVRAFYERVGTTPKSTDAQKINSFKQWLSNTYTEGIPLTIVYEVESPITETLDQELQDRLNNLRSFEDSNYVYTIVDKTDILPTVAENLKPTLHAKFLYNNWYKEDRVINNLMIYNRALTDEEMLQNYKTIKRRWGM